MFKKFVSIQFFESYKFKQIEISIDFKKSEYNHYAILWFISSKLLIKGVKKPNVELTNLHLCDLNNISRWHECLTWDLDWVVQHYQLWSRMLSLQFEEACDLTLKRLKTCSWKFWVVKLIFQIIKPS